MTKILSFHDLPKGPGSLSQHLLDLMRDRNFSGPTLLITDLPVPLKANLQLVDPLGERSRNPA